MGGAGVIFAAGAGIAALMWFGLRMRRTQRQNRFRGIADALSFAWISADDKAYRRRLAAFELFSSLDASRAYAILTGQVRGYPVTVFDYDYGDIVNGGFNPYLVLVFETEHNFPAFWLHPKGSLNSMGTGGATSLATFPELHGYVLDGEVPEPALLAHCEGLRAQKRWPSVASRGNTMIYYEPLRQRPSLEIVRRILDDGTRAYQALLG
jgi:hypothetical protein